MLFLQFEVARFYVDLELGEAALEPEDLLVKINKTWLATRFL